MTALAAPRPTSSKSTNCYPQIAFKVNGGSKIYAGGMVMLDPDGFARPAAALASNYGIVGVALETADNTSGSDGAIEVVVQCGIFRLVGASLTQAKVGDPMYASDDQTFSGTQGSNEPLVGVLVRYESATDGWVLIPGLLLHLAATLPVAA